MTMVTNTHLVQPGMLESEALTLLLIASSHLTVDI